MRKEHANKTNQIHSFICTTHFNRFLLLTAGDVWYED